MLTVAILLSYASSHQFWLGLSGFGFFQVAAFNQAISFGIALSLASLPLITFRKSRAWLPYFLMAFLVLLNTFLFMDRCIYAFFKFHFNGLVLSVLTNRAGWQTLGMQTSDFLLLAGFFAGLISLQVFLWRFPFSVLGDRVVHYLHDRRFVMILLAIGIVSLDKALYSYADATNEPNVLNTSKLIPLYQPFTIKKFLAKYAGLDLRHYDQLSISQSRHLTYPCKPLPAPMKMKNGAKRRPNILWIVIDSWRSDMLDPEITPNIYEFSEGSLNFKEHYSGGNNTRMGMFTLFYGLHGYYWHDFLAARRSPILYSRLKDLGYLTNVYSSASLDFPEFRKTIFSETRETVFDGFPGPSPKERDAQITAAFVSFLDKLPEGESFFTTLFYDAAHTKYHYAEGFGKFKPDVEHFLYSDTFDPDSVEKIKNRYKNALYYTDHLVGKALTALKEKNLLDNTVVMLTGDHGDEFRENGYFGHCSAYTPEQIQVPLVLHVPGQGGRTVATVSTHQDMVPTVLRLAGDHSEIANYSFGRDLLAGEQTSSFVVSCTWDECAFKDDSGWLVFGTEPHSVIYNTCYDKSYKATSCEMVKTPMRITRMIKAVNQMKVFTN